MSRVMRAKLKIQSVTSFEGMDQLKFVAQYSSSNSEDNSYSASTPSASLDMAITNKELIGTFKPGQSYLIDFIPVE